MEKDFEAKLSWLADRVPLGISHMKFNESGLELMYSNKHLNDILKYSKEEFKQEYNNYYNTIIVPKDWEKLREKLKKAVEEWNAVELEYRILDIDGRVGWMHMQAEPFDKEPDGVMFQCSISDISEWKETERRLETLVENFPGCIIRVFYSGENVSLEYVSDGIEHLTGYTSQEYKQRFKESVEGSHCSNDVIRGREFLNAAVLNGAGLRREYQIGGKDKSMRWIEVRSSIVSKAEESVVIQYLLLDITEQKQAAEKDKMDQEKREAQLRTQLELDSLTGLYNNQTVRKRIAEKLADKERKKAYVVLADLDNFTALNESMGNLFGDAILCTFADGLKEFFPEAIMGRTGGDDFMLYLEGMASKEIFECLDRFNRSFSRVHAGEKDNLQVSASFGFARCEAGKEYTLEKLEQQAETALLYLKNGLSGGTALLYEETMESAQLSKERKKDNQKTVESLIQTEADLLLFAHELYDNVADIKGVMRIISDRVTRFFDFQDIIYIRRDTETTVRMLYHWGEKNVRQFDEVSIDIEHEPDWNTLLYTDELKEYVVLLEHEFVGENINRAKSMMSFRSTVGEHDGYCILVDRRRKRDWKEEAPTLLRMGDFIVRRYFQIKDKQVKEAAIEYRTKYDGVTGLPNYTYFQEYCDRYIADNAEDRFALIYTDFANFQFLNEVYGYTEGDRVLREYGQSLLDGKGVFHARITADRFISLYRVESLERLKTEFIAASERFCHGINNRYEHCKLGIAGGIAEFDRSLDSIAMNVDNANIARKGANADINVQAIVYNASIREEIQKQREIVAKMDDALQAGEFKLYLQPKMDMFTDKVIGAEALVRWLQPDGTIISPGEFIPIFEKNGFVTQIDFEILRQVLNMQQERFDKGKSLVKISVNFSRRHQENPNYLRRLDEMLANYTVPKKYLEIEITESVFMQDLKPLAESVRQLKQRGISISIDDFGAGYSSLNLLSKVKADIVKLDRQFLLDVEMEKDNFTSEFLQLLINMINQLGFKVLAEGVETQQQVELLKNAGCRFAQGFYYAKPMPVQEFLQFLDEHMMDEEE